MQVTLRPFASGFADKFTTVIPLTASPMHLRFSYQVHRESVFFMVLHYIPQSLKTNGSSTASPPRGSCRSSCLLDLPACFTTCCPISSSAHVLRVEHLRWESRSCTEDITFFSLNSILPLMRAKGINNTILKSSL